MLVGGLVALGEVALPEEVAVVEDVVLDFLAREAPLHAPDQRLYHHTSSIFPIYDNDITPPYI